MNMLWACLFVWVQKSNASSYWTRRQGPWGCPAFFTYGRRIPFLLWLYPQVTPERWSFHVPWKLGLIKSSQTLQGTVITWQKPGHGWRYHPGHLRDCQWEHLVSCDHQRLRLGWRTLLLVWRVSYLAENMRCWTTPEIWHGLWSFINKKGRFAPLFAGAEAVLDLSQPELLPFIT